MLYTTATGRRQNKNSWVHSVLKLDDFNLNQCLYGSHLIRFEPKYKPVSIVESEKTAIIASILRPDFIWLATGGKAGLKVGKFKFLKDRDIILFPDLTKPGDEFNCFEMWTSFANLLMDDIPGINIQVSDYLETRATSEEKIQGFDIADYFLKWDWENEENEENDPIEKPFILPQTNREDDDKIEFIEKQIEEVIQDIGREKAKESKLLKQIRNNIIPGQAIRANKELLKKYRVETSPI
jgi:hypothetical protein